MPRPRGTSLISVLEKIPCICASFYLLGNRKKMAEIVRLRNKHYMKDFFFPSWESDHLRAGVGRIETAPALTAQSPHAPCTCPGLPPTSTLSQSTVKEAKVTPLQCKPWPQSRAPDCTLNHPAVPGAWLWPRCPGPGLAVPSDATSLLRACGLEDSRVALSPHGAVTSRQPHPLSATTWHPTVTFVTLGDISCWK